MYNINSLILPNSLTQIDIGGLYSVAFHLTCIRIPANVTTISNGAIDRFSYEENQNFEEELEGFYQDNEYIQLSEIIVENEDLLNNETLLAYKKVGVNLRYEAPKTSDSNESSDNIGDVDNDGDDNHSNADNNDNSEENNKDAFDNQSQVNNPAVVAGVATSSVAGLGAIGTILGFVIKRRRR